MMTAEKPYCDHVGLWRDELRAWVPEDIFDAHAHLGPPGIMRQFTAERKQAPGSTFADFTLEELTALYARFFSGREIVGFCAFGFPHREVDIAAANEYIAGLIPGNPKLRGFIMADPFNTPRTVAQFERARERGAVFRGVKPYFDLLGKSNLETKMGEFVPPDLLDFMNREKLFLMLHTSGMGMCEKENQDFVRRIVERFPRVTTILAHMGRYVHPEQYHAFLDSGVAEMPRVFLDMSSATVPGVYEKTLAREKLWGKLLFASDFPFGLITGTERFSPEKGFSFITRDDYGWSDPALQEQFARERKSLTYNSYHAIKALKVAMERLGLSGETAKKLKRAVFSGNALDLFGQPA